MDTPQQLKHAYRGQQPSRGVHWLRGLRWPEEIVGSRWRVAAIVFFEIACVNSLLPRMFDEGVYQGWFGVIASCVITIALIVHPRFRESSMFIVALVMYMCLAVTIARTSIEVVIPTAYSTYLASAWSRPPWRRVWLALLLLGVALVCVLAVWDARRVGLTVTVGTAEASPWITVMAFIGSSWLGVGFFWLLGIQKRRRVEDLELLRERAEMAGIVERTRIAREMHDIIAHNLSGIIALADGARYAAAQNHTIATDALQTISDQGRSSLKQMRGLLSVLREDNGRSLNAAPGVKEMTQLLAEARRAGLEVKIDGLQDIPEQAPELVQFTTYRVLQELLTNMLRYASGPGMIRIDALHGSIRIHAENPSEPGNRKKSVGFGLRGIRERAQAHGGKMHQRIEDGVFIVEVEIPL